MPNFHGFGLSVCMHTPLALGCYTILIPQFNSKKFDILFKKKKPTCVLGVPTLFEALISNNNVKNLDLSFLKYAISGGDLLKQSLEDDINKYFKEHNSKARITQGYGLSEALAAVTLAHDEVNKSGSIGVPLPGNHIKIINPSTRKTQEFGEIGEICINTQAFMMGYLNNEIETNAALQIHQDGHIWLHTGDLGYMDEDGFIFYKGRQKRMIITSGYNVYPSHIEEIIEKHPAVLQCSVVGVPHPYKQEVTKAFIVLKEGFHGLFVKTQIKEYCKKNLSHYMVPHDFVYRKNLPKTKLGKVDFKKLQSDIGGDDDE
jgi:long-chain acyl-CoA synthetase